MATASRSRASRYDLLREYGDDPAKGQSLAGTSAEDRFQISTTPAWALAVVRLGRPLSFSRRTNKSMGDVTEGAFTRAESPLIITDDCVQLQISNSKRSHTKTLAATLRFSGTSYLDPDIMLPDDWIFAWCCNNQEDLDNTLDKVRKGEAANEFNSGLKFVGRIHNIRQRVQYAPTGAVTSTYALQCLGFNELDTELFYDTALATAANVHSDIHTFMAQIGLGFRDWAEQNAAAAGDVKDNADRLIVSLLNMILGKGISAEVNVPVERAAAASGVFDNLGTPVDPADLKLAPQANKEAPFAYLVPRTVGLWLGRDPALASKKEGIFGYADILETLIGVQAYEAEENADEFSMYPLLNFSRSTSSRRYTKEPLKGTFLPVNPSFVNRPLWQLLQQFLNPAINEMYTSMRVSRDGRIVPTMVVRQIPFSTESAQESKEFPLTRFLSLPRWVVDRTMVSAGDLGYSNATRCNMVHIYGEASAYASNKTITNQLVRNPPIFDQTDIQRGGIRGRFMTVNCAIQDQLKAPRAWMEAIADWSIGSQYTLNGTLDCTGIQSPIAEGDNIEYEGVAYHVESVSHVCSIDDNRRTFRTSLELSNGMPVDQTEATSDAPRYPGFHNVVVPGLRGSGIKDENDEQEEIPLERDETMILGDPEFLPLSSGGTTKETK